MSSVESLPTPTIRHVSCSILLPKDSKASRCHVCSQYSSSLDVIYRRQMEKSRERTDPTSKMNDRWRTTDELMEKMSRLKSTTKATTQQLKRTIERLENLISRDGVQVSYISSYIMYSSYSLYDCQMPESTTHDIVSIMERNNEAICQKYPEGSFQRLFWEQQLKAAKLSNPKSMRWHPMMIRYLLAN